MKTSTKCWLIVFFLLTSGIAKAEARYPYFGAPPTVAERSQAASRNMAASIVGVWKLRQEYPGSVLDYRFNFNPDGSYSVRSKSTDSGGNVTDTLVQGRYAIDQSTSTIHMVVQGADQTSRLAIFGRVLLLEDDDDQLTFVFRRA